MAGGFDNFSSETRRRVPRVPARVVPRCELSVNDVSLAQAISAELGLAPLTARILVGRGYKTPAHARGFLAPSLRESLPNPNEIKNISTAAELILNFVQAKNSITVFHDFDVDGVCSAAQLVTFLRALGGIVSSYTPDRFTEGYGLSIAAVEKLAKAGTKLLITVDCGTSNHAELERAKRLGMTSVVVDHHQVHEKSPGDIFVNPAQPNCPFQEHQLCAAGLVWMLLIVLRRIAAARSLPEPPDPKTFLDIAALGTICDMVPLVGLNRVIAHRGLDAMSANSRTGLIALREVAGLGQKAAISSGSVAFALGPRINAAGRIAHASEAFELLTTQDTARARHLASRIDSYNAERRSVEERVKQRCLDEIFKDESPFEKSAHTVFGKDFHAGVIGIVAQRIVEIFYRPAAVMAPGESLVGGSLKPVVKGSVRSIRGFHVAEALQALDKLLISHGGHREAGGFTVSYEKLEEFRRAFTDLARETITKDQLERSVQFDATASLSEVNYELASELSRLAPFGSGNPSPILVSRDISVESVTTLSGNNLKLRLSEGPHSVTALAWGFEGNTHLRKGSRVNIAYQPELNTYQGITSVQLNVKEVWSG